LNEPRPVGLGELVVVVGHEVDDVLVEPLAHRDGGGAHARFGVARGGGAVVEGAEVAVPVDERHAHREVLREAHERVVDRRVAVRVQAPHDVADDARALDVPAVGAQAHLRHLEQDAALHGLEPVTRVGERPRVDDGVGVLEERALHLGGDVDVLDSLAGGEASGYGAARRR
jgi:hypothetical protein